MDAKETIKYLYEHGHIPSNEHYTTIKNEIEALHADNQRLRKACGFAKAQIKKGAQKKALSILREALAGTQKEIKTMEICGDSCPFKTFKDA